MSATYTSVGPVLAGKYCGSAAEGSFIGSGLIALSMRYECPRSRSSTQCRQDVLRRSDYDPYGTPTAIDTLGNFGHNRLGHQGLFADRYDADAPAADLAVDADVMYYARNRDYSPRLGRWVQRDPNRMSVVVSAQPHFIGHGPAVTLERPEVDSLYTDGLNLHIFVTASPLVHSDPMGLFALFGETMTASVVRNALFGGLAGGTFGGLGSAAGGGSFWDGAWRGALGGATGGGVGAFAGALFVNWGAVGAVGAGAIGGGVGSGVNSFASGNEWDAVWKDVAWGALFGGGLSAGSLAVVERYNLANQSRFPDWLVADMQRGFSEFGAAAGLTYTEFRDAFYKSFRGNR